MENPLPPPQQAPASRGRRRGPRRGGRGGADTTAHEQPHNTPQQSTQPAAISAPANPATEQSNANIGRSRRGGFNNRGRGRGGTQPMVNGSRAFGGQLTVPSAPGSLAGDAPEFVPGRPLVVRQDSHHGSHQGARHGKGPIRAKKEKSQAPDIATRTHEDITNGQYECVICTNEVLPNSKVWSCKTCWSVLHLSCVKRWSKNEVSTHQQRATENGELPPPRQWRCPGCNLPKVDLPNLYTCWCGKEIEPKSIPGLPPHSCAQTCSKKRAGHCPHPCELICHAGPCPPCHHMGPSLSCFCGKEVSTRRCLDTTYDSGWTCGQICGDLLPCGEHTCQRGCHEGLCGSCEVLIDSKCYCGRVEKQIPCSEREDEKQSQLEDSTWMGSFNCGAECRRSYDCGVPKHFCEERCHPQDPKPAHCPFSPDVVTHCPCGKTSLDVLLDEPRKNCSATIPHCKEKCQKELQCGHQCQEICHQGECKPCLQKVDISCRCGRTTSKTICHQGNEEPPCCTRVCRSTLNCGRHECGERCCPGEKKASERTASKRKHRPLNAGPRPAEENFEAEHICLRVCGRPLKCGNHTCAELCHKGPCRSCLEAVFEEISCACGRTVLQPPQPCGTRPPPCHFDCTRARTCGHPQLKHQCHEDDEPCPKCPYLVEKPCICGKHTLKNQPCWFTEVRCGYPCGKKLKCGNHFCKKECHRPGQCEDSTSPCSQPCGRKKTVCDHTCTDPCHAPYPCKEMTPCQAKTFITCECQHQKKPVQCLASKTSEGNSAKTLDCTDECLKLQRNAKLAAALNIDPATHTDDHIPYSTITLDLFRDNTKFSQTYEREFRVFAADPNEKRLNFKPMPAPQRAFIHALAEDFGLDSESQDPEPHRHVSIFKTPRFVSAPLKTLAQCARPKLVIAEPSVSKASLMSHAEPYNAFLLSAPKFGLTIDELHSDLAPEVKASGVEFEISFLPSGDIVLKALSWKKVEPTLIALKPALERKIKALNVAENIILCAVDGSLNILRREGAGEAGGWSQVARGNGAVGSVRREQEGVGKKSSFTVLGSKSVLQKMKLKEKKKLEEEAVDDWEREVEGWEKEGEKEKEAGEGGKEPEIQAEKEPNPSAGIELDKDAGEGEKAEERAAPSVVVE